MHSVQFNQFQSSSVQFSSITLHSSHTGPFHQSRSTEKKFKATGIKNGRKYEHTGEYCSYSYSSNQLSRVKSNKKQPRRWEQGYSLIKPVHTTKKTTLILRLYLFTCKISSIKHTHARAPTTLHHIACPSFILSWLLSRARDKTIAISSLPPQPPPQNNNKNASESHDSQVRRSDSTG